MTSTAARPVTGTRFPYHPASTPFEDIVARVLLFVALIKVPGFSFVPAAVFLALALLPVTWPHLRRVAGLRWLVAASVVAIISGALTRMATVPGTASASGGGVAFDMALWVVSFPALIGMILWAIERVGVRVGLTLILAGTLLNQLVLGASLTDWKGTVGIYVTALLLLLFSKNTALTVLTLLASAAFSAISDARFMAIVGVLSILALFMGRPPKPGRPRGRWRGTVRMLVSLLVAAALAIWAMAAGFFGREVQQRTLDQLSHPAFIIADARVEWAATVQLFARVPFGFGINAVPNAALQRVGVTAVQAAGGDYTNPYFRTTVFGPRVDLHSMLADLWFHFGLGGVLMAAVMLAMLLSALYLSARARPTIGLAGTYSLLIGCWDLLFSPMGNSDRLIFALVFAALLFAAEAEARQSAAAPAVTGSPNIHSSASSLLSR